jgi:hypothetical protein
LIRVNVSARERLDYSELEDVYLVLEEDGTEVQPQKYVRKINIKHKVPTD